MRRALTPIFEDDPICIENAESILRWAVSETRRIIIEKVFTPYTLSLKDRYNDFDRENYNFKGRCVLAQALGVKALSTQGCRTYPFTVELLDHNKLGHFALLTEFQTYDGHKAYLFDPTFTQFYDDQGAVFIKPDQLRYEIPDRAFTDRLRTEGFAEITPRLAHEYLDAFRFAHGSQFTTDDDALRAMKTTILHNCGLDYAERMLITREDVIMEAGIAPDFYG